MAKLKVEKEGWRVKPTFFIPTLPDISTESTDRYDLITASLLHQNTIFTDCGTFLSRGCGRPVESVQETAHFCREPEIFLLHPPVKTVFNNQGEPLYTTIEYDFPVLSTFPPAILLLLFLRF
jgi:hypothetical protein